MIIRNSRNFIFLTLMYKHFLFGMNNGFQRLGLEPYSRIVNFSEELPSDRLMLILRSSMMMWLMVRLLQPKSRFYSRKDFRTRLKNICAPVFSLTPRSSSFTRFARITGKPTYSICRIEILPSPAPHLVVLQLKTSCKDVKVRSLSIYKQMEATPLDDKIYTFDLMKIETTGSKGPKSTQYLFQCNAIRGEYSVHGNLESGKMWLNYKGNVVRIINAHSHFICTFAFHPTLPILATYDGVDKFLKLWCYASEFSSDPVLISILSVPESTVFSIAFHPKLPIFFIGKDNGDIEVWRAL